MKRKLLIALLCAAALCCLCAGALADTLIYDSAEIIWDGFPITVQIHPNGSGYVVFHDGGYSTCTANAHSNYVFAGYRVHDLNGPISSSGTSDLYAQFGTAVESIGIMPGMEHPVFTAIFEKVNVAVSPAGAGSAYYYEEPNEFRGFVAESSVGYVFLGWKYSADEWSEPVEYNSTAAWWMVANPSATGTYTAYFGKLAECTLSPAAFTLTKGGYTDIPVELTSLVLGKVWYSKYKEYCQAEAVSFQLHGGTLTDADGNTIPFQVADENHAAHGNGAYLNTWHTSQGQTDVMPVWIDDSAFRQAAPGIYTGTLTYDVRWKCDTIDDGVCPYGSGRIALKMVVLGPAPDFGPATFTLPADLTTLGASAFAGDAAITIVDASHVTAIGPNAFANCAYLTQIRLPANCDIDAAAFDGCGAVYVYAPAGGMTQEKCDSIPNCVFVADSAD